MCSNNWGKLIAVMLLGILGFWIISSLLFGAGIGYSMNFTGSYGGGNMNTGMGYGYGNSLTSQLNVLVKILFAVFVIALIAGLIIWIKNNIFTKEDIDTIKNTFTGYKASRAKENCSICGKSMEAEWRVCPHCGKEKEIIIEK